MNPPEMHLSARPWLERARHMSLVGFALFAPFSIVLLQAAQMAGNAAGLASLTLDPKKKGLRLRLPLIRPMAAFLVVSLISTVFAEDWQTALIGLRTAWLPMLFFLVCVNTLTQTKAQKTARILIGAGAVAASYGLLQTVLYGTSFRIQGTYGHYMTFAGVLLILALLTLGQVLLDRHNSRGTRLRMGLALCLLSGAMLMTQTRSAWLGMLAGITVLVLIWKKRYFLALPLLGLLVLLVSPEPIKQRALSFLDIQDVTLLERVKMWKGGGRIFLDHPLTGAGIDNLAAIYPKYKDPEESRLRFTHLHNNFVQIAAERGAIGLLAWLWIWLAYFRAIAQRLRRTPKREGPERALIIGSLAAVVGFLVAGVFECNYRDSEVASIIYFVMALPFCRHDSAASDSVNQPTPATP